VNPPYLLTQVTIPARAPLRARPNSPRLKLSDPAQRAMTDFLQEPPLTLPEHLTIDEAVDHMFRLGVRAFLVVRDCRVVGLMTAFDAMRLARRNLCVAEAMTPTDDMPAIGWETLGEARISDLLEIFDGTGVHHLVVLQSHSAALSSVRGLIYRERLDLRLSSPWSRS
jgi:predicted transcriptional regulator